MSGDEHEHPKKDEEVAKAELKTRMDAYLNSKRKNDDIVQSKEALYRHLRIRQRLKGLGGSE